MLAKQSAAVRDRYTRLLCGYACMPRGIYITTDDFLSHFNLQKLSDLPTVDELGAAGLIDNSNIDNAIFGTGKFYKEKQDNKKEDIYSNIDEMLSGTLDSEEKN